MHYQAKTFAIPALDGISQESIDMHIGLYAGYVKHVNHIRERLEAYSNDEISNAYAMHEMQRRLGFEFGGMRNHEYYFEQFENGATNLPADSTLATLMEKQCGSPEAWEQSFRRIAATRGVGWAMLYYDTTTQQLVQTWVDEQHLGQLPDLQIVLALDMWEHSYLRDYVSSDKGQYVDAFFRNMNWETVATRIAN
jgi:Fe-Mn family superoxide dismutase